MRAASQRRGNGNEGAVVLRVPESLSASRTFVAAGLTMGRDLCLTYALASPRTQRHRSGRCVSVSPPHVRPPPPTSSPARAHPMSARDWTLVPLTSDKKRTNAHRFLRAARLRGFTRRVQVAPLGRRAPARPAGVRLPFFASQEHIEGRAVLRCPGRTAAEIERRRYRRPGGWRGCTHVLYLAGPKAALWR